MLKDISEMAMMFVYTANLGVGRRVAFRVESRAAVDGLANASAASAARYNELVGTAGAGNVARLVGCRFGQEEARDGLVSLTRREAHRAKSLKSNEAFR